jgi:cobalamin biosynthesis Co2+ chelatase CbiK
MMTARKILERWNIGITTPSGVMMDVLTQTDKKIVIGTLEMIPPEILEKLEEFVGYYTPKTKIFNGPRPNMRTLRFVKEWFASRRPAASA